MPVRTKEQADAAEALGEQISDLLEELLLAMPLSYAGVRYPEMLEEIHWDLTQIRGRLHLAVTGEKESTND